MSITAIVDPSDFLKRMGVRNEPRHEQLYTDNEDAHEACLHLFYGMCHRPTTAIAGRDDDGVAG
jgi:hypothetical protein